MRAEPGFELGGIGVAALEREAAVAGAFDEIQFLRLGFGGEEFFGVVRLDAAVGGALDEEDRVVQSGHYFQW